MYLSAGMRAVLLALFLVAVSWAQPAFQNLTPSYNGSVLWFSSPLRMRGTEQYPHPKMFQWDEINGVRLYDQKPPSISVFDGGLRASSTAYNLLSASASADGATVAVNGALDCNWGQPCVWSIERYRSEIRRAGGELVQLEGSASLSPNGRFAYLGSSTSPPVQANPARLRDLASGQEVKLDGWPFALPHRHRVANDGTVVVTGSLTYPFSLSLRSWPSGELRQLQPGLDVLQPMINDSATRVLYAIFPGSIQDLARLVLFDVPTARGIVLASASNFLSYDFSNDGTVIAYLDAGQVWTVRPDASGKRRVTDDADTLAEVALSGDGNFLFAVTATSRILRIDLRSGALREIVPATPVVRPVLSVAGSMVTTPGSVYEFVAQALPEIAEVRLLGRPQQIIWQYGGNLLVQVPFNMVEGAEWAELVLRKQIEGPFVSSVLWPPIQVAGYAPAWYHLNGNIAALHEDFSAPVTPTIPARPGEILHVYGSGFGPVAPAPETGAPASANPLSRVIEPMVCALEGLSTAPADLLFAGLAPGWIGLYQFDVRLPAVLGDGNTYLCCGRSANSPVGTGVCGPLPIRSQPR